MPIGLLTAAFFSVDTAFAVLFGVGFLAYEITQGGNPHRDIHGYLWGLGIGGIAWRILLILG